MLKGAMGVLGAVFDFLLMVVVSKRNSQDIVHCSKDY